ncbi:MAG TPA: DUF1801 domain-containing protein [Candidatus Krumholzibacteria bacterium]|nr:DUF1801 domain-containing protein [Candidatus Krumholzibacteria bacterium]HPD70381.1 DUF1801 domain-containing protein [Candidatus Krumholzibacteria bacterium]HRY39919.1 DUF1801 domain-containing protein [Candidatus Krumholzibacteria bacterium]
MAELKTRPGDGDVESFLAGVPGDSRREDCRAVLAIMQRITGQPPVLWGGSIVGFGRYRYRYASGREGDWFLTGFSPRKNDLTLYIMTGFAAYDELLAGLGKFRTGKACLYVKRLADLHLPTLERLIEQSVAHLARGQD